MTKAKGGWYPRLERLVEALKLSPFEKHVIVSLIRTVIAPNSSGGPGGFGARHQTKCRSSVGNLLGSFCSSLEERMTFRKFFYKDSRLVKDGILNMMGQVLCSITKYTYEVFLLFGVFVLRTLHAASSCYSFVFILSIYRPISQYIYIIS